MLVSRATGERLMREERADMKGRRLCSLPLCGAPADWFVESFGEIQYYCDRHKPMVPQALLKRLPAGTTGIQKSR